MRLYFYHIHAAMLMEQKKKLILYITVPLKNKVPLIKMIKRENNYMTKQVFNRYFISECFLATWIRVCALFLQTQNCMYFI